MPLSKEQVVELYRRRARRYDFTANLYYLIGFREWKCRKRAVAALELHRGDTVVEVGCGTGLNFSLLEDAVGPEGKVIGVDITDRMLDQARERVKREGWSNVELVLGDAASYEFPSGVAGVISTFALSLVPEYDEVIRRGAAALASGGRWVLVDFKMPQGKTASLVHVLEPLVRPFGASLDLLTERRPLESMKKYLKDVQVEDVFLGFTYIAVGEKPVDPPP